MATLPFAHVKPHVPATVGQQVRVNHDKCTAGMDTRRRLYIRRTASGVLAYCHNCGRHLARRLKRTIKNYEYVKKVLEQTEHEVATRTEAPLPEDMSLNPTSWPVEAKAWLYKYHITDADIAEYGIGYSESWGRVILPVYDDDGKCIFWQGRSIDGAEPKYVNNKSVHKPVFKLESPTPHAMVVEDYLSAIRVKSYWKGIVTVVALLGTSMSDEELSGLVSKYPSIYLWLDPDPTGRAKARELGARLKLVHAGEVHIIKSEKQPKEYATFVEAYTTERL